MTYPFSKLPLQTEQKKTDFIPHLIYSLSPDLKGETHKNGICTTLVLLFVRHHPSTKYYSDDCLTNIVMRVSDTTR